MNVTEVRLAAAASALQAAGIESARLEAQLLFGIVLGVSRTAIVAGLHPEPSPEQWAAFEALTAKRRERVPLAYLRGTQEFYGLEFVVTPAVLIPRPETELLVDFAREKLVPPLQGRQGRHGDLPLHPAVADVGTGSGCIAVATLANQSDAQGIAIDRSAAAIAVARTNAMRNGVAERLQFARGDLLAGVGRAGVNVIVSNPPYIPSDEVPDLQAEVRDHEPRLALDGGTDGLVLVRRLARQAVVVLRPGGWLAVEIARGQAAEVAELFAHAGLTAIETRRDLAGHRARGLRTKSGVMIGFAGEVQIVLQIM